LGFSLRSNIYFEGSFYGYFALTPILITRVSDMLLQLLVQGLILWIFCSSSYFDGSFYGYFALAPILITRVIDMGHVAVTPILKDHFMDMSLDVLHWGAFYLHLALNNILKACFMDMLLRGIARRLILWAIRCNSYFEGSFSDTLMQFQFYSIVLWTVLAVTPILKAHFMDTPCSNSHFDGSF
jgi:hypothetical protein